MNTIRKPGRQLSRRALALAVAALMLLAIVPLAGFAADGGTETICVHEHGDACGYVKASDCAYTHEHDGACGYREAVSCEIEDDGHICGESCANAEASPCQDIHDGHDAGCGYLESSACTHVCSAASGCIKQVNDAQGAVQLFLFEPPVSIASFGYAQNGATRFLTQAGNSLSLLIEYTVDDPAEVDNTKITLTLANNGENYFVLPQVADEIATTLPAGASIEAITEDASGITAVFKLGASALDGAIGLSIPYDDNLPQPISETLLATAQVKVENGGLSSLGLPFEIISADAQAADGIRATFDGVELASGNVEHTEATVSDAYSYARIFKVDAVYTDTGDSSLTKTMVIRLQNGMQLASAPGMVQTTAGDPTTWTYNPAANPLPTALQGVVTGASWEPDAALSAYGYQPQSGTLTYTLNPTTTDLSVEIGIKADRAFLAMGNDSSSFTNPVSAEAFEGAAAPLSSVGSVKLGKYTVNGYLTLWHQRSSGETKFDYAKIGEEWITSGHIGFSNSTSGYYLFDEIKYTYRIPKQLGLTEVFIPAGSDNGLDASKVQISAIDASNAAYDEVTVTFAKGALRANYSSTTMKVSFKGTIQAAAVPGTVYRLEIPSQSWTMYGETAGTRFNNYKIPGIYILKDDDQIVWKTAPSASIPADLAGVLELAPLGAFAAVNESNDITGKRIRIDFSPVQGVIGVQALRLMAGTGGATDIVVTTTNQTITIPSAEGEWPLINLYSDLADGEYITSIEYSIGTIYSGMQTNPSSFTGLYSDSILYYGQLLDVSAGSYSPTITALKAADGVNDPDPLEPNDWQYDNHYAQKITIVSPGTTISYSDGAVTGSGSSLIAGESAVTLSVTSGLQSYRYNGATDVWARKGWVVYVREAPGLYIDPATVCAKWGAPDYTDTQTTYWNESDPNHSKFIDNTGATVYKMILPDAVVGHYSGSMGRRSVSSSASISARNTAKSGTIAMRDIFAAHALGCEGYTVRSYNSTVRWPDTYNFTGNTSNTLNVPTSTAVINLRGNAALNVATSADRGDNDWQSYYPGDDSTVVSLNTQLDARYRVDISNDSGKDILSGYVALIPIPKASETIPAEFRYGSNTAFQWSLYLESALSLGANYTVKYATDYLTSGEDMGWQDWASIGDKTQIRCVMVKYNGTQLPLDFVDSFHFGIATPTGLEAAAAQDKVNIYTASIWANIDGNAAYRPSEPVALKLSTGIVSGTVYEDVDKNGALDPLTDTPYGGVTVRAYKAGSRNAADILETTTTNMATGAYMFTELSAGQNVDIVFLNPKQATQLRYVVPSADAGGATASVNGVAPSGGSHTGINALLQAPWTVRFVLPAGVPAVAEQKVYPGGTATRPAPNPALTGYTFGNWYEEVSHTTVWNFATKTISENTTIYGSMVPDPVTINLNHNHGDTPIVDTFTVDYGSSIPAARRGEPSTNPGSDYTFAGWYNSKAAADALTQSEKRDMAALISEAGPITLYAGWRANTLTVRFFLSADTSGTPYKTVEIAAPNTTVAEQLGQMIASPGHPDDANHYEFRGWNTQANGEGSAFTGSTRVTASIDVFAQWEHHYTVTFNGNGANIQANPGTMKAYASNGHKIAALPSRPLRTYYDFVRWTTVQNSTSNAHLFTQDSELTDDITVYALWSGQYFDLSFSLNGGGTGLPRGQSVQYEQRPEVPEVTPSRSGYTFLGWNEEPNGTRATDWVFGANGTTMPARNVTLYAQWRQNDPPEENTPTPTPTLTPTPTPTPSTSQTARPTATTTTEPAQTPTGTPTSTPVPPPATNPPTPQPSEETPEPTGEPLETPVPVAEDIPTMQIGDLDVPLFGMKGEAVWALLNLILMILDVIGSIFLGIWYFIGNKKTRDEDEDEVQDSGDEETAQEQYKKRFLWTLLGALTGIISAIVFFLTENMLLKMVLVDGWTILMAILFIAEIVFLVLALTNKKRINPDDEEETSIPQI